MNRRENKNRTIPSTRWYNIKKSQYRLENISSDNWHTRKEKKSHEL